MSTRADNPSRADNPPPQARPTGRETMVAAAPEATSPNEPRFATNDLLRAAFDDAPVGMALTLLGDNGDRIIEVANHRLGELLGYTVEDLNGRTFNDLTHPDDEPSDRVDAERLRAGSQETIRKRKRYRRSDGSYVWVELHARALHGPHGAMRTLAHISGVDELVRLEAERARAAEHLERQVAERTAALVQSEVELRSSLDIERRQQQRLELLLDASHAGLGEWEWRRGRVELSDSWYRFFGHEPQELGRVPDREELDRHHHDDRQAVRQLVAEATATGSSTIEREYRVRHPDKTWRWHRHLGQVVEREPSGAPRHVIGVVVDVTDQHDRELRVLHSAKMGSLAAFAGGIAHDFNNVLAIIQGHTEALEHSVNRLDDSQAEVDAGDPNPSTPARVADVRGELRSRVTAIGRAVTRASTLVRELTAIARPPSTRPSPIDLAEELRRAVRAIEPMVGPNIRVRLILPNESPIAAIDADSFQLVISNVATNARDAMPTGGELHLRLSTSDRPHESVAVLEVSDNGMGMDPNTLASLFEPFSTTKSRGVATGLGMATAYAVIAEAKGTIVADSSLGVGTTITITLPLLPLAAPLPSARAAVDVPAKDDPGTPAQVSICVVEDEAELLELTTDVLRSGGYRVHSALGAAEAIEILEANPGIELLLTDVVMPGLGGADLATIVGRRWPSVTTLFMSGFAATPSTEMIEASKLLTKPVSAEDLLAAVSRAVDSP